MTPRQFVRETAPRRVLLVVAALVAAGLIATSTINAVIDPYDIWHLVSIPQLPNRPMQRGHDRMHKAALIQLEAPDGVVLGTSRSQVMIDPKSPAFAGQASRIVNAAVDGCIPYEARRLFEHAVARATQHGSSVKLAVYGLDLYAFDKQRRLDEDHSEARFLVSNDGRAQPFARGTDILPALLSLDALMASAATLVRRAWPSYLLPTGQRDPRYQERDLIKAGGQHGMFRASERFYADGYACFEEGDSESKPYRDLRRLLDEAAMHATRVRLYISPVHARHAVLVRLAGLASAEVHWKRRLVSEAERARNAGGDVELWDFSGVESDEDVPALGDRVSRMTWWWESGHATSLLGERLLPRMLDAVGAEELGQRLTPATTEPWLLALERKQVDWASRHASDASDVAQVMVPTLGTARRDHCPTVVGGPDDDRRRSPLEPGREAARIVQD